MNDFDRNVRESNKDWMVSRMGEAMKQIAPADSEEPAKWISGISSRDDVYFRKPNTPIRYLLIS